MVTLSAPGPSGLSATYRYSGSPPEFLSLLSAKSGTPRRCEITLSGVCPHRRDAELPETGDAGIPETELLTVLLRKDTRCRNGG
jgi:hypothetical protein